jgi:hypothetical protein
MEAHMNPEHWLAASIAAIVENSDTLKSVPTELLPDVCDYNMIVHQAWLETFEREIDTDSESDMATWNKACGLVNDWRAEYHA